MYISTAEHQANPWESIQKEREEKLHEWGRSKSWQRNPQRHLTQVVGPHTLWTNSSGDYMGLNPQEFNEEIDSRDYRRICLIRLSTCRVGNNTVLSAKGLISSCLYLMCWEGWENSEAVNKFLSHFHFKFSTTSVSKRSFFKPSLGIWPQRGSSQYRFTSLSSLQFFPHRLNFSQALCSTAYVSIAFTPHIKSFCKKSRAVERALNQGVNTLSSLVATSWLQAITVPPVLWYYPINSYLRLFLSFL